MLLSVFERVIFLINLCGLFSHVVGRPAYDGYGEAIQTFYEDWHRTTWTIKETFTEIVPCPEPTESTISLTLTITTSTSTPSALYVSTKATETLTTTAPCPDETHITSSISSIATGTPPQSNSVTTITIVETFTEIDTAPCSGCSESAGTTFSVTTYTSTSSIQPASFSTAASSSSFISISLASAQPTLQTSWSDTQSTSTYSDTVTQESSETAGNTLVTGSTTDAGGNTATGSTTDAGSTTSAGSGTAAGSTTAAESTTATESTTAAESNTAIGSTTAAESSSSVAQSLITASASTTSGATSAQNYFPPGSNSATSDTLGTTSTNSVITIDSSSTADNTGATGNPSTFGDTTTTAGTTGTKSIGSIGQSLATDSSSLTDSLSVPLSPSLTVTPSQGSVTIITPVPIPTESLLSGTSSAPSQASASTTPQESVPGITTFPSINSATSTSGQGSLILVTPSLASQTAAPSVSIVVISGFTATYTPTQVPSDVSLTTTLITSTTDAAGTPACIIILPLSEGWGWAFPFNLDCTDIPFPPPPPCPPLEASISGCSASNSGGIPVATTITSTMTTVPPGFSTEATTNTIWTGNTWLTTEVGGQSTIVPVLVGCDNCGGDHGGIILWNLPEIPWVLFKFPGFPKLPTFHLPCIKIFGITISGDCSKPPSTDGDNNNGNPSQSTPSISTGNPSSTSTESSSASTQTSSSLACSVTLTASDCSVVCKAAPTRASSAATATQSCSTTCYSTTTGCSATGTTTITTTTRSIIYCDTACGAYCGPTTFETATTSAFPTPTCTECLPGTGPPVIQQSTSTVTLAPGTSEPTLKKRTLPVPTDISDVKSLIVKANNDQNTLKVKPRFGNYNGGTTADGSQTALSLPFHESRLDSMAVGFYGCTSVIVISQNGVWLSHFYESPYFINKETEIVVDDETFKATVINTMLNGDGTVDGQGQVLMPGLLQDISPNGLFSPDTTTTYMIVTPKAEGGQPGEAEFGHLVDLIEQQLQQILPGFQPSKQGTRFAYQRHRPAVVRSKYRAEGKILVQYDPDQVTVVDVEGDSPACSSKVAMARIYMMDQDSPIMEFEWPSPYQDDYKRDTTNGTGGSACSLTFLTSQIGSTITSSVTSPASTSSTSNTALTTRSTSTANSIASATTSTPPPVVTGTTCNCNEDGCTTDSPACCADGTCGTAKVVRAALASRNGCNCNEDSCSPESPACCANGTCGT